MAALHAHPRAAASFANVRPPKRSHDALDGRDDGGSGKRLRESPPWDLEALHLALTPYKPVQPVADVDMAAADEEGDQAQRGRTIEIHPAALGRLHTPDPPIPPDRNHGALVLYKPIVPVVEEPLIEEAADEDEDETIELAAPRRSGSLRRRRDANAAADVFEVIEPSSPVSPSTLQAGLGASSTSLTVDELPAAISSSSSSEAGDDAMEID